MARLAQYVQLEISRIGQLSWNLANGSLRASASFAASHRQSCQRIAGAFDRREARSSHDAAEILDGRIGLMRAQIGVSSLLNWFVAAAALISSAHWNKLRRRATVNVEFVDVNDRMLKFAVEAPNVAGGASTSTSVHQWA